ncbi:hypothetical protein [Motilimonas eburnea]|uniref:hypothetical protein n=1 Tax=Motilimonas eburnea TaxID=1737488 RepID=UPI001E2A8E94|nr:hypothetical protein [Motilimonas eburnea]MCE2569898.1 hypothetical protein [Motilimonas eburnea]
MTKSLAFYYVFGSISPFYLVSAFKSLNDAFEEIYGVKAVDIEFVEVYSGEQAQ